MAGAEQQADGAEAKRGRQQLAPTAQRILKAARRILVRKGYPSLTMQAIEKESGANRALIHYYFGSKAGLVHAIVESLFEDPDFGFSDDVLGTPAGEARVRALIRWQERISRDERSTRLLYELVPHAFRDRNLRSMFAELYGTYRAFDGQCLSSGAVGSDSETIARLASLTVAVVEGLGVQHGLDPDEFDHAGAFALWERMVMQFLDSESRPTGEARGAHE